MPEIGVFTMVVLIVLIVSIARVQAEKHRAAGRIAENEAGPADRDAERIRDEVRNLRQRIAVLERIATENNRGLDLDREIERLRDRP